MTKKTSNVLPVDLRRFHHQGVTFRPDGPVIEIGSAPLLSYNPVERTPAIPVTARLFVGLSVGQEATWTIDDVVRITKRVRVKQGAAQDSSFLLQRGVYTDNSQNIVDEDSVQVVIFDFAQPPGFWRRVFFKRASVFESQMVELAETFVRELRQETVYVDMQRAGVSYLVLKVT